MDTKKPIASSTISFHDSEGIHPARRATRIESEVSAGLKFGYKSNEIGFGWTNAAFTELYAQLPERQKRNVLRLEGMPLPPSEGNRSSR